MKRFTRIILQSLAIFIYLLSTSPVSAQPSCTTIVSCPVGQYQTICPLVDPRTCCTQLQSCPEQNVTIPTPTSATAQVVGCRMCNGLAKTGEIVCPGNGYVCCGSSDECSVYNPPDCVSCDVAQAYPGYKICNDTNNSCCRTSELCQNLNSSSNSDTVPAFRMCEQLSGDAFDKCAACVGDPDNPQNVWTALGCVPTSPQGFAEAILKLGIGLGGGIALLLMIFGAFQVAVSSGDPKTADAGKQTFTGAIIGLLFIIFSVVILRFIGFDILKLPGF